MRAIQNSKAGPIPYSIVNREALILVVSINRGIYGGYQMTQSMRHRGNNWNNSSMEIFCRSLKIKWIPTSLLPKPQCSQVSHCLTYYYPIITIAIVNRYWYNDELTPNASERLFHTLSSKILVYHYKPTKIQHERWLEVYSHWT